MLPLVYELLHSNGAVRDVVGVRIYRHGEAPQGVDKPYITWFLVNGAPENNISDAPCADVDTVQIDCYSPDDTQAETLAYAVRAALDAAGHVNHMVRDLRDPDTKLYLMTVEADFIRSR